jgi:poly-gamma-glutamate capsule biosynthesis protein CapA/YwtB (metallophosphatase superfamily)
VTEVEAYLASVATQVRGAGAERLTVELRDHLDDAIAHQIAGGSDPADAVRVALERLGPADEVLAAWKARARARRAQDRRRAALVAFAAVTASALALVQHASGRQPTPAVPIVTPAHCVSPSLAFGVGRTAHCRCPSRCR